MLDRQALWAQLLNYLQSVPQPPEYLGTAPDHAEPLDPYQTVGEWMALRHEVKQQNKLLQAAQTSLQQSLEAERLQNTQLQQRLAELATLQSENQYHPSEQKVLLQDLLKIMDALDQACEYWRSQILELSTPSTKPRPWWKRLFSTQKNKNAVFMDVFVSNQQGIEVIRRSLLDLLRQRQVIPIVAVGQPFDPTSMYAIGRQESDSLAENTVIQEVVRGYLWQDQVLREAQVMVAVNRG